MRRFLVVGCGGSGGKTLAYLMDQLRSDLAKDGVDQLPAGWQFVLIDVPTGIEPGPDGLGHVAAQGGRYVGMGPRGGSYLDLDTALAQKLRTARSPGALGDIGTWAPARPEAVNRPIDVGAGQYRAIGRMILLNRAGDVRQSLSEAWSRLFLRETESEMAIAARATNSTFNPNDAPIVFVIGSMAGGSGASMVLDVCRLLTQIPNVNPNLMSVFMVSSDIFDSLPPSERAGVRANSLAMLGEIVASQTGAARSHDVALLNSLGYSAGDGAPIPFARVFPVGRRMGVQRAIFGDGSMNAVYRGLARGLAGLISSDVAIKPFIEFDLGNGGYTPANPKYLGWGAEPQPLPWGSFGFASLSMGRDRYAEYAAQRIARTSVDRLLDGHLQPGNPASGTEQVTALVDSQWGGACTRLGLPAAAVSVQNGAEVRSWMTGVAYPREEARATAQRVTDREFAPYLSPPNGQQAGHWREDVRQTAISRRRAVDDALGRAAYAWAFAWYAKLFDAVQKEVEVAVSRLGLPYAGALIERLIVHLGDVVGPCCALLSSTTSSKDIADLTDEVASTLSGIRGAITGGEVLVSKVVEGVAGKLRSQLYAQAAGLLADGMRSFVVDALRPLQNAVREAERILEQQRAARGEHDGLARLETNRYNSWPSDRDERVPQRFDEANNEVLLTTSRQFGPQYDGDLVGSLDQSGTTAEARTGVAAQVISGRWPTEGGEEPPAGLLELVVGWRSRSFPTDPKDDEVRVPSIAQFDLHIRPQELLDRARMYVRRPNTSFQRFCAESLRDYLSSPVESEREGRQRDLLAKFREVLTLAVPLIGVDEQSVRMLYGRGVEYRYKFSEVPFRHLGVSSELEAILVDNPTIDGSSLDSFRAALTDQGNPRRIDVIGSYPLYSPLVFDSILEPVAQEWDAAAVQARGPYWSHRRARPLAASLPMSDQERRAMVAGWYLGQLVGELVIPEPPYAKPVRIWSAEDSDWLAFPYPMLTSPDRFRARTDWLPAVLESYLLAIASAQQAPVMSSLKPYQRLRELYDASDLGPVSGIHQISALTKLADWLRHGPTNGRVSRIATIAVADDPAERLTAARRWLLESGGPGELARTHFLPYENAAHGQFSVIDTRKQASSTPYFRDLAADVRWATEELAGLLLEAERRSADLVETDREDNAEDQGFGNSALPDIEGF